jgi:hypothetical protein
VQLQRERVRWTAPVSVRLGLLPSDHASLFDKKSFSGQQIQPQFPCSWIDIKNGQSVVTADLYLDVTDADGRLAPTDLRDLALPLEVNACKA